ncbi:type I 3-dehydroquinate dehydratase [Patescibacteria group bacterium]|nr:type I 3-dehydroquinate dehydratase [Patescibacteria group bacterium]
MKNTICIPIQAKSQKQAKIELKKAAKVADMAEIWLDHIRDLDIPDLLKNKPLPVICVCKKANEKGKFKGTSKQLIEVLFEAAKHGADYIDMPFANSELRTPNSELRTKLIISYHNFTKTPSTSVLLKKALEMHKKGADIVKISVMAKSLSDAIRIIALAKQLQSQKIPHILIAMGKKGILSRILTPTLGGTIMFAPLTKAKSSAPGQLSVNELKEAWSLLKT